MTTNKLHTKIFSVSGISQLEKLKIFSFAKKNFDGKFLPVGISIYPTTRKGFREVQVNFEKFENDQKGYSVVLWISPKGKSCAEGQIDDLVRYKELVRWEIPY